MLCPKRISHFYNQKAAKSPEKWLQTTRTVPNTYRPKNTLFYISFDPFTTFYFPTSLKNSRACPHQYPPHPLIVFLSHRPFTLCRTLFTVFSVLPRKARLSAYLWTARTLNTFLLRGSQLFDRPPFRQSMIYITSFLLSICSTTFLTGDAIVAHNGSLYRQGSRNCALFRWRDSKTAICRFHNF